MADPTFIKSLTLQGFRAYLHPKTFDLAAKRSIAIFAPNGQGKSSVVDALEFLLSRDGTLERLGQRAVNNQAGPVALVHNLAEEAGIAPWVKMVTITGRDVSTGERSAAGTRGPIPPVAASLSAHFAVSPIIRGYVLRTFVEAHTAEKRYEEVAGWLQLAPLVEVQKNLRALKTQVKAAAEDLQPLKRIDGELSKATSAGVTAWDDVAILEHVNTAVIAPLDVTVSLRAIEATDPSYRTLETRAKAEENRIGIAGLRQMRSAAVALHVEMPGEDGAERVASGAIVDFAAAVELLAEAEEREEEERGKAASAVFKNLWEAAEKVFVDGAEAPDACPVCATPINDSTAGSSEAIRRHVAGNLDELAAYANAKRDLDDAERSARNARTALGAALPTLIGLLGDDREVLKAELVAFQAHIADWPAEDVPDASGIVSSLETLVGDLHREITQIEERQGDHTYLKAKAIVDRLIELAGERSLALRTTEELVALQDAMATQATTISSEIRAKVQSLLDTLQSPMNTIYRAIQGEKAKPVRLELPGQDDANQQRLHLLVDFADNRTGVQPGGYLSDSQIHSVALALRLAAIRRFNAGAPVMALDDIVTSYDADHRRAISALIASELGDCQVIITTHDERFFNYLKDQIGANAWQFTRIIGMDASYGPRFAEHRVTDAVIEARWAGGDLAANEMRQAEEEWLLAICRDFGVSVRIRTLERAYAYERSELASALAAFLKGAKLQAPRVAGVNNRFLDSLIKGEVENFGSHFQNTPYGDGSMGDEKTRWQEFKAFRAHFACGKCGRGRFQRPHTLKKPLCAHESCEAQFEFAAATDVTQPA